MNCPYCGKKLKWFDYFEVYMGSGASRVGKIGDIYKCINKACKAYNRYFWVFNNNGILHEGHPFQGG